MIFSCISISYNFMTMKAKSSILIVAEILLRRHQFVVPCISVCSTRSSRNHIHQFVFDFFFFSNFTSMAPLGFKSNPKAFLCFATVGNSWIIIAAVIEWPNKKRGQASMCYNSYSLYLQSVPENGLWCLGLKFPSLPSGDKAQPDFSRGK